jgi:hypothetical protein
LPPRFSSALALQKPTFGCSFKAGQRVTWANRDKIFGPDCALGRRRAPARLHECRKRRAPEAPNDLNRRIDDLGPAVEDVFSDETPPSRGWSTISHLGLNYIRKVGVYLNLGSIEKPHFCL